MLTCIVLAILLGVAPGLGVIAAAVVLDQVADIVVCLDTDPAALLQRIESYSFAAYDLDLSHLKANSNLYIRLHASATISVLICFD